MGRLVRADGDRDLAAVLHHGLRGQDLSTRMRCCRIGTTSAWIARNGAPGRISRPRGVMMEASPAAPFVVPEPHLLLEVLVVALDPPAHLGHADEGGPLAVRWQCREPVLGRLVLTRRPFPGRHSTSHPSRGRGLESVRSRWAGRMRGASTRPPLGFGASGSWPGDRQVRAAGQRLVEPSTPIA